MKRNTSFLFPNELLVLSVQELLEYCDGEYRIEKKYSTLCGKKILLSV